MSSQQYTRKTAQLNQEQSAVLDGLTGWVETGKEIKWNDKQTGEAKSFYKKYSELPIDDNTLEACNILANLGLGLYDKADSFSGVYRYTINKNTLEKELIRKGSSGGGKFTPRSYDSEGAKKGHEENVKMHEELKEWHQEDKEMFDAKMLLDRALLDAIALLKQEIRDWREDENRREQRELGETKE